MPGRVSKGRSLGAAVTATIAKNANKSSEKKIRKLRSFKPIKRIVTLAYRLAKMDVNDVKQASDYLQATLLGEIKGMSKRGHMDGAKATLFATTEMVQGICNMISNCNDYVPIFQLIFDVQLRACNEILKYSDADVTEADMMNLPLWALDDKNVNHPVYGKLSEEEVEDAFEAFAYILEE